MITKRPFYRRSAEVLNTSTLLDTSHDSLWGKWRRLGERRARFGGRGPPHQVKNQPAIHFGLEDEVQVVQLRAARRAGYTRSSSDRRSDRRQALEPLSEMLTATFLVPILSSARESGQTLQQPPLRVGRVSPI